MRHVSFVFAPAVALFLVASACTSSTTGSGASSSSSSGGSSGGVSRGSETAPDEKITPTNPQPSGKACNTTDDCAYWFCKCSDGAVVNSRVCADGYCQAPSAHCDQACNVFNHGGWTGQYGGGDSTSTSSSSSGGSSSGASSTSSSGSSGSCTSKEQCSPFECGCTDGSRISVRDCYGGVCSDATTGCQSACEDSGRGDWDGT